MGVMSCHRKDCDSIMCDTYVEPIGYICVGCQEEFENYLKVLGEAPTTDVEIVKLLEEFVRTKKGFYNEGKAMSVAQFFKEHTKN